MVKMAAFLIVAYVRNQVKRLPEFDRGRLGWNLNRPHLINKSMCWIKRDHKNNQMRIEPTRGNRTDTSMHPYLINLFRYHDRVRRVLNFHRQKLRVHSKYRLPKYYPQLIYGYMIASATTLMPKPSGQIHCSHPTKAVLISALIDSTTKRFRALHKRSSIQHVWRLIPNPKHGSRLDRRLLFRRFALCPHCLKDSWDWRVHNWKHTGRHRKCFL